MNALTETAPQPSAALSPADPLLADSPLNFIARALADPGIDVDKLQMLLRMQREIVAEDAKMQFNRAMSRVQADMQPVVRDALNTQTNSKYARLETIDAAIRPIYTRHGFCLSFDSEPADGSNVRIVCEVSYTAGHVKTFNLEAALDLAGPQGKANKTPLHALGSSVSYLRRYLTCMAFNVALTHEDTDGNRPAPRSMDGRITEAQVAELHALIKRTRTEESRFLRVMCPDLNLRSVTQASAADFSRLRNALLTKANILAQRATAERQRASQGARA